MENKRVMNVKTWLQKAKQRIDALDAELIAHFVFAPRRSDRSWLAAHGDDQISQPQLSRANVLLEKRLRGVPLAYVLEHKEFYGRDFWVRPGVLIPRPETESLIDIIKELDLPQQPKFLEIGTGSGCIAITLALEYPQAEVIASDISTKALGIAERNDIRHEGRVEFVQANLLRDLGLDLMQGEHFDVLVANLPYVNKDWEWVDENSLSHEPSTALYAKGNNGLSIYQRLLREISYHRNLDELWLDYLVLEADPCQHEALIKMAEKANFTYLKTDGYALLFEDGWRYWWDWRKQGYVHKTPEVIADELKTGMISYCPEEDYMLESNIDPGNPDFSE